MGTENYFTGLVRIACKKSPRDRLFCLAYFVGMTLLAAFFLLPLPNCFLRVCLPTLCCCLELLFTTNSLCNFWCSKIQQSTRFTAGARNLRRNGIAGLTITCASAPNPRPRCRPTPLWNGISICLEATNL